MQEQKSVAVAGLLGFAFGFIGLLYVMPLSEAAIWWAGYIALGIFSGGVAWAILWPVAAFIGMYYAWKLNQGVNPSITGGGFGATCPQCRRSVAGDASFCTGCGFRLQVSCGTCRRSFPHGTAFCAYCGAKLI